MSSQARAILMLDFDGVLHPASGHPRLARLPFFEHWLRRRSMVDIVIASAWREHKTFSDLVAMFSLDLRQRIVGATPLLELDIWHWPSNHPRYDEAMSWLREHAAPGGPWDRWAALDDRPCLYLPFMQEVVAIADPRVGVTERELAALDRLLHLD